MRIVLGSDHRGTELKAKLRDFLESTGHDVTDIGPATGAESVDYPDYAFKVARKVADGECERGILVCSSGIGMSMAANRGKGVRAALVHTEHEAQVSRAHNNANVLCFGQDTVDPDKVLELLEIWIKMPFEGGRHERRVSKLDAQSG